ncbi:MAG: ZIP family metal transporter [Candidatus Kariarchaeaceae archaeon]
MTHVIHGVDHVVHGFFAIFIVSLASFIGAITLASKGKKLPIIYTAFTAFATGALIATVFYHILPEAVEERNGKFTPGLATLVILGLLIPFILEKTVHWHHHHSLQHEEYIQHFEEDHPSTGEVKPFVFVNLLGDGLHNFVDGAVLIATFSVSTSLGFATFLGILVHELAQELGDFSILVEGGLPIHKALAFNFLSALTAFLGGFASILIGAELIEKVILPLAAGNFLYLAIADLIPEMQHKTKGKDWITQIGIGMLGVLLMYLLTFYEGH